MCGMFWVYDASYFLWLMLVFWGVNDGGSLIWLCGCVLCCLCRLCGMLVCARFKVFGV